MNGVGCKGGATLFTPSSSCISFTSVIDCNDSFSPSDGEQENYLHIEKRITWRKNDERKKSYTDSRLSLGINSRYDHKISS